MLPGEDPSPRKLAGSREEQLLTWLVSHTSVDSRHCGLGTLELRVVNDSDRDHRGLFTRFPLAKGDMMLRVPMSCCIMPPEQSLNFMRDLCRTLIQERRKGAQSTWFYYIQSVPSHYELLVTFDPDWYGFRWSRELREAFEEDRRTVQGLLRQLSEPLNALVDLTIEETLWAWCTVTSRSCYHPVFSPSAGILVPIGDMLNHEFQPDGGTERDGECRYYKDGRWYYEFRAHRAFAAGEEITVAYGQHSNVDLLRWYGFALEANPFDEVRVFLSSPHILEDNQLFQNVVHISSDGEPSYLCLRDLRLALASPEEISSKRCRRAILGESISEENEAKVRLYLRNHMIERKTQLESLLSNVGEMGGAKERRAVQEFAKSQLRIVTTFLDGDWSSSPEENPETNQVVCDF
mmetsp:Transcript_14529/g.29683  ORF Transcript_14529/g.29683 Transcript_14529/m.29683 type:complete len:406 (-) Transcript_14529:708-1925(-)|eukprot:CAMPEP_0184687794 /NCGR_PEP_ID=MMETSP0312-20130426/27561_1 /TAXON_ID=31354 /ORGANISM="Compsopogon coeruleus, Strain SAG 36.94" /LENGTH=405 /DNA_ID=CAMNT_0027144289 /DNA_START=399 /DNA_END=1616 /DNA_ORIENTATION=-